MVNTAFYRQQQPQRRPVFVLIHPWKMLQTRAELDGNDDNDDHDPLDKILVEYNKMLETSLKEELTLRLQGYFVINDMTVFHRAVNDMFQARDCISCYNYKHNPEPHPEAYDPKFCIKCQQSDDWTSMPGWIPRTEYIYGIDVYMAKFCTKNPWWLRIRGKYQPNVICLYSNDVLKQENGQYLLYGDYGDLVGEMSYVAEGFRIQCFALNEFMVHKKVEVPYYYTKDGHKHANFSFVQSEDSKDLPLGYGSSSNMVIL